MEIIGEETPTGPVLLADVESDGLETEIDELLGVDAEEIEILKFGSENDDDELEPEDDEPPRLPKLRSGRPPVNGLNNPFKRFNLVLIKV